MTGRRGAGMERPALRAMSNGVTALAVALVLAACSTPRVAIESHETFDSGSTYSRTFPVPDLQTCEAARRALLSQGYLISAASSEQVRARKHFQPASDLHVEVDFTVVCAKQGYRGVRTVAFANAVQDSYALKKSNTSASLGVPALGAVSVPFIGGSDEALVKVASVTISNGVFYERFFQLVERFLAGDPGQLMPPAPPLGGTLDLPIPPRQAMPVQPVPPVVPPAPPASAPTAASAAPAAPAAASAATPAATPAASQTLP